MKEKNGTAPPPAESGKKRLLQAAYIHFQKHSYASTRVEDLCRAARISKGAFYLHFKTKEEMMEEMFRQFFLQIKNGMIGFLKSHDPSPMAALELFRTSLEVTQGQLHMTRVFFESLGQEISGSDRALNSFVGKVFDDIAKELQKWLGLPDSERIRIRTLISSMDGIVLHWAFFGTPQKQRSKQIDAFLELVDHSTSGVLPREQSL
ncbi:MAG: TetR/AcrR family transcriptional regulator [Leptospiraceae bacterium]|nr:TetR/AcrR family transcriptional regulator [Leptospiraceae bacterium]